MMGKLTQGQMPEAPKPCCGLGHVQPLTITASFLLESMHLPSEGKIKSEHR